MTDIRAEVARLLAEAEATIGSAATNRIYARAEITTLRAVLALFDAQPVDRDGKRVVTLRLTARAADHLREFVETQGQSAAEDASDPRCNAAECQAAMEDAAAILSQIDAQGAKS